ncbi:MAG TPA: fibronectin type III domain-containing protein, partial [Jatrophihabitantaceae bacterium]
MVARRAAPAFRPSAPARIGRTPSRLQSGTLLLGVIVLALAISVVSFVVRPSKAKSFDLFYGSLFINDNTEPVAVDLASGKPSVRLHNAYRNVSAASSNDLDLIPLDGENTLMLDPSTGQFNMVDSTGFVVKPDAGGVRLPAHAGISHTSAVPSGDSAFMLQSSTRTSWIYLISQLTVASAVGLHARAKARAYATVVHPLADVSAPAAAANGSLWMLTDTGAAGSTATQQHSITELSLPAGSNAGATLTAAAHGSVTGPAAVGSSTVNADGTGGEVAAVASTRQVQVFGATDSATLPISVPGTVLDIEPASNAQGRLSFLYQTTLGWTEVTAPTTDSGSAVVHRLTGINPGARLVPPAASDGHLYTMDDSGAGDLWQIEPDGRAGRIIGAPSYPYLKNLEKLDLTSAQVLARGGRVVFNARANNEAEVVFSDGSSPPRAINKRSAVEVDPTGATTLANGSLKSTKTNTKPTKAPQKQRPPTQPVNTKIDCRTTHQTPHIPQVTVGTIGSRSVQLSWHYPTIDPQDCVPSTYTVQTQSQNSDAPGSGTITVQSQTGVTLTDLFPDTTYEITVTAYLSKNNHTSALAVPVHTSVEGPAAPTDVRTSVDSNGNWTIAWHSCGGIKAGCVPVANWQIVPRFCDGRGLSSPPDTVNLVGDPTLHIWRYVYRGSDALLGRGLGFTIQGVGTRGTVGDPTGDGGCSYSWTQPVADAITVQASKPPVTNTGQTTTATTVVVHFADSAVHDLGGVDGQLSYQLRTADGTLVSQTGPTTQTSVKLNGITAGKQYQVVVKANPPRHPEAAVQLPAVDVQPTFANWPAPHITASFSNTSPTQGTLNITPDLGGADTDGETFDFTSSSFLKCGNTEMPLDAAHFPSARSVAPGQSVSFTGIDRSQYYGDNCTVAVQLTQNANSATNPPLYGAGPSRQTSTSISISPPSITTTKNDFTA